MASTILNGVVRTFLTVDNRECSSCSEPAPDFKAGNDLVRRLQINQLMCFLMEYTCSRPTERV